MYIPFLVVVFNPTWGNDPIRSNLTNIFQMGWNHQLDCISHSFICFFFQKSSAHVVGHTSAESTKEEEGLCSPHTGLRCFGCGEPYRFPCCNMVDWFLLIHDYMYQHLPRGAYETWKVQSPGICTWILQELLHVLRRRCHFQHLGTAWH